MKAILRHKYGSEKDLHISEIPPPSPKEDELLIKVFATTVNRTDCAILTGRPLIMRAFTGLLAPKVPTLGTDFGGIVAAVGQSVKGFVAGERVWGFDDEGISSQAEYMTISERKGIARIPYGVSFEQAAASAEAAHYAYNIINKIRILPGQSVVVNGASGGIGSALVQLLRFQDAQVTAVCGPEAAEAIRSLGVQSVIDYSKEDFTRGGIKYDYVLDAVGKSTFFRCRPILKKNGVYISSELGPFSQNIFFSLLTPMLRGKKVRFPLPTDIPRSLSFIGLLLAEKRFAPLIDRTYPLSETNVREAYQYVRSGRKIGNVILAIHSEAHHQTVD